LLGANTLGLMQDRFKYLMSHKYVTDKTLHYWIVNKVGLGVMVDVYKIFYERDCLR